MSCSTKKRPPPARLVRDPPVTCPPVADTASSTADILAQLTGPGGPFQIVVEDVCGVPTQVYKQRMRSMRELMAQNAMRPDAQWLVQGERRYTFGEHDAA